MAVIRRRRAARFGLFLACRKRVGRARGEAAKLWYTLRMKTDKTLIWQTPLVVGFLVVLGLLGAGSLTAPPLPSAIAQESTSYTPTPKNFDRWLKFISPNEEERSFERIGWRNQFWPAVEEARRLGRPILLWTMNGHPLGCT